MIMIMKVKVSHYAPYSICIWGNVGLNVIQQDAFIRNDYRK